ncbi:diadenylate cyclase [Pseudomonas avellanae]|uniref:diadenylate cyclase n=1 Tax=Pseudomonas avellanae TaxID=46257 RepID=UPI0009AF2838|nr:diadenylate cyclase [Pseudomonas avellanae]
MNFERLVKFLDDVTAQSGSEFSGVGVIVSESYASLPVFSMRMAASLNGLLDSARYLAEISRPGNDLHDGFHVLSADLEIVALAQYFSPPIPPGVVPNRSRAFGGRYLAALFGSSLPGVILTGISTPTQGIAIFKNGSEVYFQGP